VHDALPVGVVHGAGQDLDQLRRGDGRLGDALEFLGQAAAVDVLQGEERRPVPLADLVDLHDVGVPQGGDRLGLRVETSQVLRAGVGAGQDHLQGHDVDEQALVQAAGDGALGGPALGVLLARPEGDEGKPFPRLRFGLVGVSSWRLRSSLMAQRSKWNPFVSRRPARPRRLQLTPERLEDRTCPTVSITDPTTLYALNASGAAQAGDQASLALQQQAIRTFRDQLADTLAAQPALLSATRTPSRPWPLPWRSPRPTSWPLNRA
jgi:hypothetical protein